MDRTRACVGLALCAVVTACGSDDDAELVARAGDYELTVDEAVELLVDEEGLPTQGSVVRSLAQLWIDYTLLAEAAAEDTTFADLDFDGLVQPLVEQLMVLELRDSAVQVDTAITPEELEALYAADAPALELRARHILLTFPVQATQAQRDSVRAQLEDIRSRILAGASFEEMARTYSRDPGTASDGGDLGYFGRGDMVAPFEEAVLTLEQGEVSEVVQTPLGLHLIRLDDRRIQSFDEVAGDFRAFVQSRRYAEAESTYIAELEGRAPPVVADGALEVARELARAPETRLSGQAARRPLVEWEGGAYTAGELLALLRTEQGPLRDEILRTTDDDLRAFLQAQGRRELLVEEARRLGLEPSQARVDSLRTEARVQLRQAARTLGLLTPDRAPGEDRERAIARAVRAALVDNLSGASRIVPLGPIGYQLREGVPAAVFEAGVGQVMLEVAQVRAARPPSPLEEGLGAPSAEPSEQPADTAAR